MNINPFIDVISIVLYFYGWVLFAYIILSWLLYFGVINRFNPFVQKVNEVLIKLVEPILGKIRKFMPDLGGIDLSPIVLILLIYFIRSALYTYLYTW